MESKGITQAKISEVLAGRSKGYVSDRILGKRSWAISELDRIAPLFGLPDVLVGSIRGWSEQTIDEWNAARPGHGGRPRKTT